MRNKKQRKIDVVKMNDDEFTNQISERGHAILKFYHDKFGSSSTKHEKMLFLATIKTLEEFYKDSYGLTCTLTKEKEKNHSNDVL